MVVSNKFLRACLQPLLSESILFLKSFPALCISEREWKEPSEREASLHAEGSKDSHPLCAIHIEISKGTMVGKILQFLTFLKGSFC